MWKGMGIQIFSLKKVGKANLFSVKHAHQADPDGDEKVVKNRSLAICFASDLLMFLATDIS